jgi:hypothetical protein
MPKNSHGHIIVEPAKTPGVKLPGVSDTKSTSRSFPGSPFYTGELTDEVLTIMAQELLLDGVVEGNDLFGPVSRDYDGTGLEGKYRGGAPCMEEVATGGGGLPGTAFSPNIASPGPENGHNFEGIPPEGAEASKTAGLQSGAPFITPPHSDDLSTDVSIANPRKTTKIISNLKIGSLIKGKSTPPSTT